MFQGATSSVEKHWNLFGNRGIKAPDAWRLPSTWRTRPNDNDNVVKVAVLDTGIQRTHPELNENMHQFSYDAVKESETTYQENHATPIAGIIGAIGNQMCGIAHPIVKLIDLKCLCSNTTKDLGGFNDRVIECIKQAMDHNVTILNCSFSTTAYSKLMIEILKQAREKQMIFVLAAGNANLKKEEAKNYDETDYYCGWNVFFRYPASYVYGYKSMEVPRDISKQFDNMIVVAATQHEDDKLLESSHFGPITVEIGAPGKDIFSTRRHSLWDFWKPFLGKYQDSYEGTSVAVPHVTAALALLKAKLPEAPPCELIRLLHENADTIPELRSKIKGGKRLNLVNALLQAEA